MTKLDKYHEGLLRRWGAHYFSEDLGYPHRCAYLKDYRPKGYKELPHDLDAPEVERLALWMPINLGTMRIHVLRTRYRKRIRHRRKAARWMKRNGFPNMSEQRYNEYLNDAYRIITERF